jgi:hypothetical protein
MGASVVGVIVLATAFALVLGVLSPRSLPVADTSDSPTVSATPSTAGETSTPGAESASPAPTGTAPATPTPTAVPSDTPGPTPTPAPSATPVPTAAPVTPGTLTFRLHVDSVAASVDTLNVYVMTDPAQPRYHGSLEVCARWDDEPCGVGIYEVELTGLTPSTTVYYAVFATGTTTAGFSDAASHAADGSVIDLFHPAPAPESGSMTFRLTLPSIPAGTRAYTLYAPHLESGPDRYELCGPSTGACVPGTYQRTFTDYWPRAAPFAYYALERSTTAGEVRVTNAGLAAIDGSVVEISSPPAGFGPVTAPANPACAPLTGSYGTVPGGIGWSAYSWRTFTAPSDLCVPSITLGAFAVPGIGMVRLTLDGTPILEVDLGRWYSYGVDGASSGDREIVLATPMWVMGGQRLALDYSACVACGTVSVTVHGERP